MNKFIRFLRKSIAISSGVFAGSFFFILAPSYASPERVSPSFGSPGEMIAIASGMVERGDKIIFPTEALKTDDNVVSIEWQQDFKQRKADYVIVVSVIDNTNVVVPLFVQKSMRDKLLDNCATDANECSIVVDEDFQYGQNNEKTFRFLVYHNKAYRPYQHRFINTSTVSKIVSLAKKAKLTSNNELKVLDEAISKAQAIFGDYLRDFSVDS